MGSNPAQSPDSLQTGMDGDTGSGQASVPNADGNSGQGQDQGQDQGIEPGSAGDTDQDKDQSQDKDTVPGQSGQEPKSSGDRQPDQDSNTVPDQKPDQDANTVPDQKPDKGAKDVKDKPKDDESLWYSTKIPMKKDHQKLLWDYCKKRNLDYIDMLSLINVESNFNEKCSSGRYKGYFQISSKSGPNLAKTLKTENKPLDGTININWGTALYSWILADKRVKDLEGQKKRDTALSIYNRGTGGFDKYGLSKSFLNRFYAKRKIVSSYFNAG